jgi:hypothetical protein
MLKHYYNIYARTSATVWPTTAAPTIAETPSTALLPASRKDYIETKPKYLPAFSIYLKPTGFLDKF